MKLTRTIGTATGAGIAALAVLLLIPTLTAGGNTEPAQPAAPAVTTPAIAPAPSTPSPSTPAAALLAEIPTAGPAPAAEYDRDLFGQRWADVDRNGCDTRNDTLARDLVDVTFKPGTHDCVVLTGTLLDPYTGETVTFTRVSEGYQPVQIDHRIPLAVAWSTGAANWTDEKRRQFANDPANLQATTANQTKGDSAPAEWLPAGAAAACEYSTRYIEVAYAYELAIADADRTALASALSCCATTH